MTDTNDLPPDLAELDSALSAVRWAASVGLRARVLGAVGRELRAQRARGRWLWAAGVAAAIVAWANLSLSITAGGGGLELPLGPRPGSSRELAGRLRQVLPELSASEAMAQAIELRAAGRLVPRPRVAPGAIGPAARGRVEDATP